MIEVEKSVLKEKWDRLGRMKEENENDNEQDELDNTEEIEKLEEEMNILDARSRQIFSDDEMMIDFGNLRATDCKENKRVKFPKPLTAKEEAEIETRRIVYGNIFDEFVGEMCDEKGVQEANITSEEEKGLKSLKRRVKSGELIVCQTDKSGRFAVLTTSQYESAGSKHIAGDTEVDLDFVARNERLMNGHTSLWMKFFGVGINWNQVDRNREVKLNHSLAICPMKLYYKDHKGWTGHMGGPPPSRPIASANLGYNVHFSELVSQTLEPVANKFQGGMELLSTCDLASKIT